FLASTHGDRDLLKLQRRCESIDSLAPDGIYWRDVVARFVAVDDIIPLIYDFIDLITGVVRGIEYDGESRSGRQPERRDDLVDGNLGFLLERLLEIWREFFFDVHSREVGKIGVSDLEARGDELVPELRFLFDWIVQLGDAIGGVASFPNKCIVDMKENLITSTDSKLIECVLSVTPGKSSRRPICSVE